MGKFFRNIIIIVLLAVCFVVSGAQAGEESGAQDTNEEVRFLTWYILLSDSVSAEIQGFVQTDVSFVFLLSNQYGSPTADGHYEGKSCYTWQTNYDTAKVMQGKTAGYDFYALNAQSCSVELIPDPLNPGKLTGEFSVTYSGKQDWSITGSIGGGSKDTSGAQGYTETARVKMIVDLFKSTDKGGNRVMLYYIDPAYPEYHAIPMYGYLFSSDELSQEEFNEYVDKLNERVEKEESAKSPHEQRIEAVKAQLETARRNLERAQELAANAAATGRSDDAVRNADNIDRERARIESLEAELEELGASPK